jgi:hypothetical protein
MRAAILVLLYSATAWGKPKVAVVPLSGDLPGNKLSSEVVDALGDDFTVASFKAIGKVTKQTGELDDDAVTELERELPVRAVIHGKVVRSGAKKSLQLKISVKGRDAADLTVKLKGAKLDDDGKAKIHDELKKDLTIDDDDKPKPLAHRHEEPVKPEKEPEEKPRKRVVAEEPDEPTKVKKRHKKHDEDEPEAKRAVQDIFVDGGMAYGMRRLSYDSTAAIKPPTVSTASASGRVEGTFFLKAVGATGPLARFGIGGEYDKAFGLSIKLGMLGSVPIDEGHYSIGARYRIDAGVASVVVIGLDYAERHYIADRSALTAPSLFDAPDTDYQSNQRDASARTPFTPAITGFATAIAMLPFAAGPIQKSDSYGPANAYGLGLTAGIDVAVASAIGLRIAGEAEQISLTFKGTGSLAQGRMVTAATDRQLGIFATLALFY